MLYLLNCLKKHNLYSEGCFGCLQVLADELIKPDNPITNYLTEFSGITPVMMEKVTMRLQDAQVLPLLVSEQVLSGVMRSVNDSVFNRW